MAASTAVTISYKDTTPSPQTSRAETILDREDAMQTPQKETNIPEDIIYVPETTETRVLPPNFEIKEAYVKSAARAASETAQGKAEEKGVFSKIAGTIHNFFKWRKMPMKNSRVTPDSGSNFLDAERAQTTQDASRSTHTRGDNIPLDQVGSKPVENNPEMQSARNQSLQSGYTDTDREILDRKESYESNIFSVNSAGNPIPITIENDRNNDSSDDTSSELSEDSNDDGSQVRLRPTPKEKFNCKNFLIRIWKQTYHPNSIFMYCWLLLISLIVLYNAWIIPLRASFIDDIQTPWQGAWFAIDALCDICFIVDIFIKFRTRFVKHGIYVDDRPTLNHHHKREWTLFLDVAAVFPTDLFLIKTINPYVRLNRILKVYRAYSFYRTVEIKTWWPNVLRLTNLIHTAVIIVHYTACIYYSSCLSNGYGSTLSSWAYPNPSLYPTYASLTRRYTHSFYWSLQELTLIGGRATPEADWQYVYNIYLNLVGIALTAYVIGYLTMILLGKNTEKFEFEKSMETTRKYMKKRKLPKELRRRVEEFYDYTWNKSEFSHLDEEKMLRHLPISIKEEIAYFSNYNALKELPQLAHCDSSILKSLVSKLKRRTYLPGQFVYKSGDAGTEMYIVNEGVLQIIRERDGQVTGAREGDIFGEMNIFNLRKNHRRTSDVVSCGYSELYVLTAEDAHNTLAQYPRTMNVILQQAKREKTWLRRKMSQNFYHRRNPQYRYFPSNSSNESIKLMNSPSNVQLSLKSNSSGAFRASGPSTGNSGSKSFKVMNDSPDSGMPSSRKRSEAELSGISALHSEITDTSLPPDLATKLIGIYQKNLKSFQKSLDDIWFNEYVSLKQQLSNTETERDDKAREINRLRHRADNEKPTKRKTKRRDSSAVTGETAQKVPLSSTKSEKKEATKEQKDNSKWQSNMKFRPSTNANKRRTILPTLAGSTDSLNTAASKAESVT